MSEILLMKKYICFGIYKEKVNFATTQQMVLYYQELKAGGGMVSTNMIEGMFY